VTRLARAIRPTVALAACLLALGCGRLADLTALPARAAQAPPARTEVYGAPGRILPAAALDPAACGAVAAQDLVGAHFTALAGLALPGPMRILLPGQSITDAVQPDRLNAQVSETGLIRRLFCG
jgi:hypothetical protein